MSMNKGNMDLATPSSIDIGSLPDGDAQSINRIAILVGSNVIQDTLAHVEDITLHTGVRFGLALSINADPTRFDVAAGEAIIVDRDPIPEQSVVTRISFAGQTGILDTNLTEAISHIFMDSLGVITVDAAPPQTIADVFDRIYLGTLLHFSSIIVNAIDDAIVAHGSSSTQLLDLVFAGGTKLQGSLLTGNANLTLNITSGILRQLGRGFATNKNAPNEVETPASSPVVQADFFLIHIDASGDVVTDNSGNVLDPTQINTGGLGTLNVISPANDFSIIRVFQAGNTNDLLFYYGTEQFSTISDAMIATEPTWVEAEDTRTLSPIAKIFIRANTTDIAAGILAGTVVIQNISSRTQI